MTTKLNNWGNFNLIKLTNICAIRPGKRGTWAESTRKPNIYALTQGKQNSVMVAQTQTPTSTKTLGSTFTPIKPAKSRSISKWVALPVSQLTSENKARIRRKAWMVQIFSGNTHPSRLKKAQWPKKRGGWSLRRTYKLKATCSNSRYVM